MPDHVGDRRARRLAVEQRGVDLQRYVHLEAVQDDPCDLRAILFDLCLPLDHRGDDQHLVRGQAEALRLGDDILLANDEIQEIDETEDGDNIDAEPTKH